MCCVDTHVHCMGTLAIYAPLRLECQLCCVCVSENIIKLLMTAKEVAHCCLEII